MWSRIGRSLGLYGPTAPETEPIVSVENAGNTSPPPEATHPVKIEPGLNDSAYPQKLLDADIPDCSQRAEDVVRDLQFYHFYYPGEYQHGRIGDFHPPAEFKNFDEENLWQFLSTNPLDLSPPALATWQTHTDWRRRALWRVGDNFLSY